MGYISRNSLKAIYHFQGHRLVAVFSMNGFDYTSSRLYWQQLDVHQLGLRTCSTRAGKGGVSLIWGYVYYPWPNTQGNTVRRGQSPSLFMYLIRWNDYTPTSTIPSRRGRSHISGMFGPGRLYQPCIICRNSCLGIGTMLSSLVRPFTRKI